uniref:Uncharacterized protein n=1 Tax=Physcomitrium patens TaxID=3218 RepID=A0A2K1IQK1_PHYPA|nr:hypothetical protein PHYPA_025659 [Physcomitrium patens]
MHIMPGLQIEVNIVDHAAKFNISSVVITNLEHQRIGLQLLLLSLSVQHDKGGSETYVIETNETYLSYEFKGQTADIKHELKMIQLHRSKNVVKAIEGVWHSPLNCVSK